MITFAVILIIAAIVAILWKLGSTKEDDILIPEEGEVKRILKPVAPEKVYTSEYVEKSLSRKKKPAIDTVVEEVAKPKKRVRKVKEIKE